MINFSAFAGIGSASRAGMLIKGGNYLEALSNVGTVVFDKTGTITKGNLKISKVVLLNNDSEEDIINKVASVEQGSLHPLAKHILARSTGLVGELISYKEFAGFGVYGELVNGDEKSAYHIGNAKLLARENIACTILDEAGTIIYVAENG